MNYYIEENSRIVIFGDSRIKVEKALKILPKYEKFPIKRTTKNIVEFEGLYYFEDDEEYIAMKEAQEHERIQSLSMTRSDFFDSTIKAWGTDSSDLLPIVENMLTLLQVSDIEKKIAINNYNNALNFYRKHTLFTLLSGVPITIGEVQITITPLQWDNFFDKTNKRDPEAYKELLPQ